MEYVDLDRNPSFLKETVGESNAANYSEGDYIVKCGDNIRRIDGDDMYETTTQQYYFWTQKVTTGLQAETKLTSSIIKVTSAVPVIYYSSGFGETSMNRYSTLVSYIENSGFDFQSIDLKTENLPDDAVAIMFFGPTEDLTGEAEDKLDRWLMKGGNAFFFMDVKSVEDNSYIYNSFDNFGMIFNKYGITLGDSVVSETGDNKYEASSDVIFRTDTVTAGALEKLKNTEMYILNTRNIDVDPMADLAEAEAFLVTSDSAEAKSINDGKTLTGKQIVGASGKYSGGMKTSRIVVFGSSHSFTDATLQFFGTAAETVMRYSMDWMNMESSSNVGDSIEAKRYNNRITSAVIVTESHQTVIAVAVMIVIPLIILIVGLVIWLRRRHL